MSAPNNGPLVLFGHDISGTTAQRPSNVETGQIFYDTTIGALLAWNGTSWDVLTPGAASIVLVNGTTATTQAAASNDTKVATDAYADQLYALRRPAADGVIFPDRLIGLAATQVTANRMYMQPIWLNPGSAVTFRSGNSSGAAGQMKFALWKVGVDGKPSTFLGQSTAANVTSALNTGVVTAAIIPGPYWVGVVFSGTPTMQFYASNTISCTGFGDHFNDVEGSNSVYFAFTFATTPTDSPTLSNDLTSGMPVIGAVMTP
jgi:hypothetical protein